jgi:hypothetical protein
MAIVNDESIVKKEFVLSGEVASLLLSLIGLPLIALLFPERLQTARKARWNVASVTLLAVSGTKARSTEDTDESRSELCLRLHVHLHSRRNHSSPGIRQFVWTMRSGLVDM